MGRNAWRLTRASRILHGEKSAAMNFYASKEFLEAAAEAHFNGRAVAVEDVAFGDTVLRLLVVDGKPVTKLTFLDVHQPLSSAEITQPLRKGGFARQVVTNTIAIGDAVADPNTMLAPFVDWSLFPDFEAYKAWLLQRNKGLIKDRERRGRALAAQYGDITFTIDDAGDDVFPFAQHWKSAQLIATGHPNYFSDSKTLYFFEVLRVRGLLKASTLRAGGKLISVWIGFIHQAVWSGWIFTYDPAFKKYSVGHQLIAAMLEESFRLGHREFDFSEGAEEYKMLYATHARVLDDVGTPPWSRRLVSLAKSMLASLSPALLTRLTAYKRGIRSPKMVPAGR
jgi:CelD/BcsL family acetyltransferase involved in cellulose biosynthesis